MIQRYERNIAVMMSAVEFDGISNRYEYRCNGGKN